MISHLDYVCKVFSFNVVVGLDEDLSEDGFSNGVVFGVEFVKPMERVTVLIKKQNQSNLIFIYTKCIMKCPFVQHVSKYFFIKILLPAALISYRMHVKGVYAQVKGCEVHALKHIFEGLTAAAFNVNDLPRVFLHGSLDESQQVLLIHAG